MNSNLKKKSIAGTAALYRVSIQMVLAFFLYMAYVYLGISIWLILAFGAFTGLIFGKVFCRWICPIGVIMELFMGFGGSDGKFRQMYQYHKIGCPIAWISGALNRFSLFKLKTDASTCISCGLCDKSCYISKIEPEKYSLYKKGKEHPGDAFSCSRCLSCVAACPNGSLSYKVK
ncbi:MAG: 4Fe-4S binding protein [Spirochaetales bacterium]|nr:4Fe-4S binding protein [Spirochaetales bacterium]